MEPTEYKEKLKQLGEDYEAATKKLKIKFALSNAKFKVGDIIKDERWTILVDKITTSVRFDRLPEPVYHGVELIKNLTPNKKGTRNSIYGHHGVELVKPA